MADTSPVFAPDVLEQQRISQRQQLAQALMNQGANQGQTQVINGFAVRNSPWLGLVNMLAAGYGGKLQREAQEQQAGLDSRKQQAFADALRQLKTDPDAAIDTLASNPGTSQLAMALASKQFERNMPKPFDPSPYVGKYTPESIQQFTMSHNYGDLRPVGPSEYQQQQLGIDRQKADYQRQQLALERYRIAQAQQAAAQGKIPAGYRSLPNGDYEPIPGGPADPNTKANKPPNEGQAKANAFALEMQVALADADDALADIDKGKGANASYSPSKLTQAAGAVPFYGNNLQNFVASPSEQKYYNAMRRFITAKLRADSGATITDAEIDEQMEQLVPRVNDSKEVKEQKRAALLTALNSVRSRGTETGNFSSPQSDGSYIDDLLKKYGAD